MAGESAELVDGTSVDVLSAGVENSESIFDGADPIFEAGVLEAGDVTDILGEGGDLLEGVLELGAVGIGRVPMILFESSFLGWEFSALRLSVSIPFKIGRSPYMCS